MYVRMHVRKHVGMHVFTFAEIRFRNEEIESEMMHVCLCACMLGCLPACLPACMHACMHVYLDDKQVYINKFICLMPLRILGVVLVGGGALHSSEAEKVHDENTTVECSSVNSDWQQNLQVPGEVGGCDSYIGCQCLPQSG